MFFVRFLSFLVFLSLLTDSAFCNAKKHLTLLSLNDTYEIAPVNRGMYGGMARIASYVRQAKAENPSTLFLDAGDFIGSSVASKVFAGKQMIDVKNLTGLDFATFGNHEFDFGAEALKVRLSEATFPFVSSNVYERSTGTPFGGASPFVLREIGGLKLGIFALTLPETASNSYPGNTVEFRDPIESARVVVNVLQKQGADFIVALTHLRIETDRELAERVPGIGVIIGGHDHFVVQETVLGVKIIKAGTNGKFLGKVDVGFDLAGRPASVDTSLVEINSSISGDPTVAKIVAGYESELDAQLMKDIAYADDAFDMTREEIMVRPSPLAIFFAEIFRKHLGAQIGILNGGGLRKESIFGPGPITLKDLVGFFPYPDPMVKVEIYGKDFLEILEHSLKNAGLGSPSNPRFLHYSGMEMEYDLTKPPGSRVTRVKVDGHPMVLEEKYTLAVDSFLYGGGDEFDFSRTRLLVPAEEALSKVPAILDEIRDKRLKLNTITRCVEALS